MYEKENLVEKRVSEKTENENSGLSAIRKHLEISTRCELLAFYIRQTNPYSCSAASVAIVLNSMRAKLNKFGSESRISQKELVNIINVADWKEKISTRGFRGRHGLSIQDLGAVFEASLKTFSIPYRDFKIVSIHPGMKNLQNQKDSLYSLLSELRDNSNLYMIAHFNQGVYTGDWFGGHISPVGDYDTKRESVFVLDVDREVEGPYWVSREVFFQGLIGESKTLGTKGGGYVAARVAVRPV